MARSRILAGILFTGLTAGLAAQSGVERPRWETLLRAPLPPDAEPSMSVFSMPVSPAHRPPGTGHTHAGPVFAYILKGEIENQVEPDPPQTYKPGDFFYESPRHVHRFLRNLSTTEPAKLIIFQAGYTGTPAPVIKLLLREPLRSTVNQEVRLLRLTLPAGGRAEAREHSGPGIVYVADGKIQVPDTGAAPKIYGPGGLFVEPAGLTYANASGSAPVTLLVYQVDGTR